MKIAEYRDDRIQNIWHNRELAERCKVQDIREIPDDHPDVLELREKQRAEMHAEQEPPLTAQEIKKLRKLAKELPK